MPKSKATEKVKRKRCGNPATGGSTVQSLHFSRTRHAPGKPKWTKSSARKWAGEHGYETPAADETPNEFRFRQFDPGRCQYRQVPFGASGISAVTERSRPRVPAHVDRAIREQMLKEDRTGFGTPRLAHDGELNRGYRPASKTSARVHLAINYRFGKASPVVEEKWGAFQKEFFKSPIAKRAEFVGSGSGMGAADFSVYTHDAEVLKDLARGIAKKLAMRVTFSEEPEVDGDGMPRSSKRRAATSGVVTRAPEYFNGKKVAFTGKLGISESDSKLNREWASGLARGAGATVVSHVPKDLDVLVVGAAGSKKYGDENKIAKAEALNEAGAKIKIMSERAFLKRFGISHKTF